MRGSMQQYHHKHKHVPCPVWRSAWHITCWFLNPGVKRMQRTRRIGMLLGMMAILPLAGCGEENLPLVSTKQSISPTSTDMAHARQLIAEYGCVACHTVPGVKGPAAMVGPPLEKLALRGYI